MINLMIGAIVLPNCFVILQSGYEMAALFSVMSGFAIMIVIAGILVPVQVEAQRLDRQSNE